MESTIRSTSVNSRSSVNRCNLKRKRSFSKAAVTATPTTATTTSSTATVYSKEAAVFADTSNRSDEPSNLFDEDIMIEVVSDEEDDHTDDRVEKENVPKEKMLAVVGNSSKNRKCRTATV